MKLYASYTRSIFEPTVKRVIADLKAKGFEVIDPVTSLTNGEWKQQIVQFIHDCDVMLVFVTQGYVRQDSFGLKEVEEALHNNKKIVPIVLEQVQLPMSLVRFQALNMTDINRYDHDLNCLVEYLNRLK